MLLSEIGKPPMPECSLYQLVASDQTGNLLPE